MKIKILILCVFFSILVTSCTNDYEKIENNEKAINFSKQIVESMILDYPRMSLDEFLKKYGQIETDYYYKMPLLQKSYTSYNIELLNWKVYGDSAMKMFEADYIVTYNLKYDIEYLFTLNYADVATSKAYTEEELSDLKNWLIKWSLQSNNE